MSKILVLLFVPLLLMAAAKPECQWNADLSTFQLQWTAFKTTQKVGVNGGFNSVQVVGPNHHAKLENLLQGVRAEIALSPTQIKTGNPARDETLYKTFFSSIAGQKIEGKIESVRPVKTPNPQGNFVLKLKMNGKQKSVPMTYSIDQNVWTAKGSLDVLDFGLKKGFEALHQACEVLHQGSDGVSKTWTQVDLQLSAKIERVCPQPQAADQHP